MKLRKTLAELANVIAREAEQNENFRIQLTTILGWDKSASLENASKDAEARRKGGRRTPAVLDPVEVARQSEDELRRRLAVLDIEQLRDVVAQYGMDPGKLVMKWKDIDRVVDRIVEMAIARSKKGDAFRAD